MQNNTTIKNDTKNTAIRGFRGDYRFLSNFYGAPVSFNGVTYDNAESAFQAQKQPERAADFMGIPPNKAKILGRKLTLRTGWDTMKRNIMLDIVRAKFTQNAYLKYKLLATGNAELIEDNTWNDTYWGVCRGEGLNHLGRILMQVRDELRPK